jgi:basic membrane protein A
MSKENEREEGISRRDFIKTVGVAAAAGAVLPTAFGVREAEAREWKVAIGCVSPRDDQTWGTGFYNMYQSVLDKKKYPEIKEVVYSDFIHPPEMEAALQDWASRGFDFIQADSAFYDAIQVMAPQYPKVMFGIVDGNLKGPNIQTVDMKSEQSAYLMGMAAGMMTKNNVLGWIAAAKYPDLVRVGEAYKLGSKSVNPKVKVLENYIGTWEDQALAYEAASAMADSGADIFIHIADQASLGVIKLIKDRNLWNIGEHTDQRHLLPNNTIGAYLHAFPQVFERNFIDAKSGNFGNKVIRWGAEDGWPMVKLERDVLPLEVQETVQRKYGEIACGKFEVPYIIKPSGSA